MLLSVLIVVEGFDEWLQVHNLDKVVVLELFCEHRVHVGIYGMFSLFVEDRF
jgi:hypothetical protein